MRIKDNIIGLLMIIGIFLSYHLVQPMGDGFFALEKSQYHFKKHGIQGNKHAKFKRKSGGVFYIRAGLEDDVQGMFNFKQSGKLSLKLDIYDGVEARLLFKHNDNVSDSFLLRAGKPRTFFFDVRQDDDLEVIAEHTEFGDAGKIKATAQFQSGWFGWQNQLIPFLWSLLFIFLWGKKHTWIAGNTYFLFLLVLVAQKNNFSPLTFQEVVLYMLFSFALAFASVLVQQELARFKRYKAATMINTLLAFAIYVIPASFILYDMNFDAKVSKDILFAVFQTNGKESLEYVSDFVAFKYIALFVLLAAVMGFLLHQQERKETHKIERSLLLLMTLTFFMVPASQISELTLPRFITDSFAKYNHELKLFRQVQQKRKSGDIKFSASKQAQGETYIVVIGESLNKKNMGLYDYVRPTTPLLSQKAKQGNVLVFTQVYANYSYTIKALQLSLTEANQYNSKDYYDSLSIVDVLKQADVETHWLTNQVIYGGWDNMISVIASEADHLVALNHTIGKHTQTQKFDGALIEEVKKVLAEPATKNRVIFVHLMGSHGSYALRYPESFARYTTPLDRALYGSLADASRRRQDKINAYDNSIVYNDFVVSSLIDVLAHEKGVAGLWYMPDHADDALGGKGHSTSKFNFHMLQIPMLVWVNTAYQARYPDTYQALRQHVSKVFTNDLLYDSLLGFMHVQSDRYEPEHDLTHTTYTLNESKALVLHGKKKLTDAENNLWWQRENLAYLQSIGQQARVLPSHVNSIGKLQDIWHDGGRAFEMDTFFDAEQKRLRAGSQAKALGASLTDFLAAVDTKDMQRIWVALNNFSDENMDAVLQDLAALDKKFHLKDKLMIESGSRSPSFKRLAEEGWQTSFHLPSKDISRLLDAGDTQALRRLASTMAKQLQEQQVSGISFDMQVYDFVQQFLVANIPPSLAYYAWYAPALQDTDFKSRLEHHSLYQNPRVRLLLTRYRSQYD